MTCKKLLKGLLLVSILFLSLPLFASDWLYTVRPNEQALTIGNKYLVNPYRIDEILKYNQIEEPGKLTAGTVLKIPLNYLKFGPARVHVLSVQGDVAIISNNKRNPLTTLSSVQLGDKIITGKNSSTMIRFADKSELLLGSEAELIFDVLTQWGRTGMVDSRMRLMRGSVEGRVETLDGPGAHFEVHTPSAVATVRGTEFRVRVNKDNTEVTYNEVSEGKVQVKNNVAPLLVPQGFGTVSEKGKKADEPIELLPAPNFTLAKDVYPAKPVALEWEANAEATGYRVEIFADKLFKNQIDSRLVEANKIALNDIATGKYALRVRSIDVNGLEGIDAKHYFELHGAPESPQNLSSKEQVLSGEVLEFEWDAPNSAEGYLLEISRDENFQAIIVSQEADNTKQVLKETFSPGKYFWRVSGTNEHGTGYPSQSKIISVELPVTPTVSHVDDIEVGNSVAVYTSKVPFANSYQWQISKDRDFSKILISRTTNNPELLLEDLEQGTYFVRVAAEGPNNLERYSESKEFEVYEKGNGKNPFMLSSLLLILLAL